MYYIITSSCINHFSSNVFYTLSLHDALPIFVFGEPFLTQSFAHMNIPFFGEIELTTVTIFETGVALTVVGVVVTIILSRSEEHTSELQSRGHLVCRLLLEKKNINNNI